MIVLDASALLEVLLRTPAAKSVEARIFKSEETLHAPHLLDLEVAQVLRRYVIGGAIEETRAREALTDFQDLPLERYAHTFLLPRVWELRRNLTAYDAVYVALAEILETPLVTRDARLAKASGHRARIELVR
jgi:predicted nucleic acid-binding protein